MRSVGPRSSRSQRASHRKLGCWQCPSSKKGSASGLARRSGLVVPEWRRRRPAGRVWGNSRVAYTGRAAPVRCQGEWCSYKQRDCLMDADTNWKRHRGATGSLVGPRHSHFHIPLALYVPTGDTGSLEDPAKRCTEGPWHYPTPEGTPSSLPLGGRRVTPASPYTNRQDCRSFNTKGPLTQLERRTQRLWVLDIGSHQ